MIQVKTRDFGMLEMPLETIYKFPQGLYGFDSEKEFVLFSKPIDDISFLYLQSTEDQALCFFVFEPWDLFPDFNPLISREELEAMEVTSSEDLIFLSIAAIPSSVKDMTINLKSPIVINTKLQKGMQIILQNADYEVRFHPFTASSNDGIPC